MSAFAMTKDKIQPKVHNSEYIRSETEPAKEDTKPAAEPVNPSKPEAE